MRQLYRVVERLARTALPVLVLGESGAGKENVAAAVHAWSPRAAAPLVALNCAALQESLVESELFGYERGAFSGAVGAKLGLLERADGGTLFLDEVNELSAAAQAKLLRVLEEGLVNRLGGVRERRVDLRVVAATNRALAEEVAAGRFRRDLFFRLSGATVLVPPLRSRPLEIAALARHFAAAAGAAAIDEAALARLLEHPWPGNVRELRHAIEYAAALAEGDVITPWHLPDTVRALRGGPRATPPSFPALFRPIAEELRDLERRRMLEALRATGGVQRRAAELIGMPVRTFTCKLTQYGLRAQAAGLIEDDDADDPS
jgi:DNA-binding NtrC family response regulator